MEIPIRAKLVRHVHRKCVRATTSAEIRRSGQKFHLLRSNHDGQIIHAIMERTNFR